MKRYFYILIIALVVFSPVLRAQWAGDGLSPATAFYGQINGANPMPEWNTSAFPGGVVYVGVSSAGQYDLIIESGGSLSIGEGITVKFCTTTSDLIIRGTGSLHANGSATQKIVFTKNTQASWGHIAFEGSTGSSQISHSIIENGLVFGTNESGYGGGIHINTSSLTVSDSEIRNNTSTFGGGIFINKNVSPVITRCRIHGNKSTSSGGGIYIWSGSAAVVSNSIIYGNTSQAGGGGGGIFLGRECGDVRIINSTIVSNSAGGAGKNVHFYININASKPSFINSVIWSPENSIAYTSQTPSVTDFINCAILSPIAGSTTNSITLSLTNNDPVGPNFTAPNGSDWSIQFISPLRDAGTNASPGVTIPANDYVGNERVYIKDIGAYEYQYSRWKANAGSTDWATASNWEASLVPGSTSDIVIPSGASPYPTGPSLVDVTVGTGKYFIMEAGSRATVNNLTNGGTLRLLSNSSAFSSIIATSYSRAGSGTEAIQVFLSGGGTIDDDDFKWHYISSPVTSLSTSIFTGTTLDLAQFIESRPTISLRQGWVAFDGYIYSTGGMGGPTFNNLSTGTNGKGYNYWHSADQTYTFSGVLNTSAVSATLGFSNNGVLSGYNLLGNPFMSGLDWNYIINDPGFPLNTTKGLYFTRDNMMCSYINGVGVPGDVTGIIPPMQGFFSKTYSTGNTIVIPLEARTHNNIHARYKGSETVIPLVRLALAGTDITDETVVRFDDAAKSGLDNDFDAEKFFILETKTYLYTTLGDVKYTINGLPFPETRLEIPVVVNVISDGAHTISATQLQGLDNYRVSLFDQQENRNTDLRINPAYTFSAAKGTIANRFVLIFSDLATSSEKIETNSGSFSIFELNSYINIISQDDLWDGKTVTVNLLDLTGRTLRQVNGIEFRKGSPILFSAPEQKGVYLVEIRSGIQRFTGKVLVK